MKKFKIRHVIQAIFFIVITLFAVNHSLSEAGKAFLPEISLHAICPFGGVETFYTLVTLGILVKKVKTASIVLMVLVFILTLFLGPVFCGWICPLGSLQEWIGKLGKKLFKKRYNHMMPVKLDKYLRFLRYFVLIAVIYVTARSLTLIFADYDPYYALFNFWTGEVAITAIIILVVTILLSLIMERPWCKYLCPYGALLGIFNLFSIFKIHRNETSCISCKKCTKVCPMNITVDNKKKVTDHQCIRCLECTSEYACPVDDTLDLKLPGGKKNEN
ncbi:MAG: 4Fe-4S binding protein [Clostridia bacterium]|nr:4Fe-4S binding protein [Clostridia bacterium]